MAFIFNRFHYSDQSIYTVNLYGTEITVTVTSTPSVLRNWLSTIIYHRRRYCLFNRFVVGLGVHWTPDGTPNPPPDTFQLCVGCRCIIFQLSHSDRVPINLRRFLLDPSNTFVGFWNHSDRNKLLYSEHGLEMCKDPIDLRYHAETQYNENLVGASVEKIVERSLGFEVEQSSEISMSNWGIEVLSEEQVLYASVDAHCAFLIGKNCRAWELER